MLDWVGENNSTVPDQNTQFVVTLVHEWWSTGHHFVEEDTKGPPVDGEAVALHVENLGGKILSSSAERVCLVRRCGKELGQTKVCQTDVPISIHEHILRLEISVHNLVGMQVPKSQHQLSSNKLHCRLLKSTDLVQMIVDVSTRYIFKEEINSQLILENVVHGIDKGMTSLKKNVLLVFGVCDLVLLNKDVLINTLHGIHLL